MLYLSGSPHPALPPGAGLMLTPQMGNRIPDSDPRPWAADTGCFNRPDLYSADRYLGWLERQSARRERCLFATAPDVFQDAAATLELARPMLREIRAIGYPAALVCQDWADALALPWDEFDAVFIGGSNAWKRGERAFALIREARARGKWCHHGRVNGWQLFKASWIGGYNSADGTMVAFHPTQRGAELAGWIDRVATQSKLIDIL